MALNQSRKPPSSGFNNDDDRNRLAIPSNTHLLLLSILLVASLSVILYHTIQLNHINNEQFTIIKSIWNSLNNNSYNKSKREIVNNTRKPLAWIYGENMEHGYLYHVIDLFQKIGFRIWTQRRPPSPDDGGDWMVLWAHEYPFTDSYNLPPLKSFQKVNHFPGSGYITNKVNLATTGLKHIPIAFNLPGQKEEFLKYAQENPKKLWVQKDNRHRGIKVKSIEQLNLEQSGTFVQEFIQNPLLIDGKKFDIGLYVTMTSLNPLRLYVFDNEALLRFCARPYPNPFNQSDLDSYVVGDKYTPIWEIPSLAKYYVDLNMNMKQSLNAYIKLHMGQDPQSIWIAMEESIKTIYYVKEKEMLRVASAYPNLRNFFELVRFDFALDENLNVYLMEANMSPNLASAKYPPNRFIYEQVIYSVLSLVGITHMPWTYGTWNNKPNQLWNMLVNDKDLSILPDLCSQSQCIANAETNSTTTTTTNSPCELEQCDTCANCLTEDMKIILKDAYMEEMSRWHNKRLIPSTSKESPVQTSNRNYLQDKWFIGKCLLDEKWCN